MGPRLIVNTFFSLFKVPFGLSTFPRGRRALSVLLNPASTARAKLCAREQ